MDINTELLRSEYTKLVNKLHDISKVYGEVGEEFDGIDFDDEEEFITYRTYTYRGCYDYCSFHVNWEDINKPLSYFVELSKKKKEEKERLVSERTRLKEEEKERRERELLKTLINKYGEIQ
jgi:hypothetical protein